MVNGALNIAALLVSLVMAVAGVVFFARGLRQAKTVEAQGRTIEAQEQTIDSQTTELQLKSSQISDRDRSIEDCRRDTARLQGTVDEQAHQIDEMRQLLMGEKVPEAMGTYMATLAANAAQQLAQAITASEQRLNAAVEKSARENLAVVHALGSDLEENTTAIHGNTEATRALADRMEERNG